MEEKKSLPKLNSNKSAKGGIPVSKIPTSGRDSGTHSRSSSVSNLTTASDIASSEAGESGLGSTHGFKLEDRVFVNGTKPGIIKFLGKAEFSPGIWAGILLDDAVGKNDGSVDGVKYFTCEPMKGIFARPQKLTRTLGAIPASSTTNLKGIGMGSVTNLKSPSTTGNVNLKSGGSVMGSTTSLRNAGVASPSNKTYASPTSASKPCSKLRLGEKVAVNSTTGVKMGTLRFIGETDFAKGEWAGIELDEPVGKNDGSVAGKRYFNCPMKYGLFSPIHKISRVGGTSISRTPSVTSRTSSVRGTPLARSTSRDSLSSSVSNCSKSSRVKLGVTSLTSSSQKVRSTGVGIMTTSRALEEALKEKEQHIEQLLKEYDMGRAEVAKLSSRCEEIEAKYAAVQNQEQAIEEMRNKLEQQMGLDKRKLEDLQFQLEEEMVVKGELEAQLQEKNKIFSRLEEFLSKALDNKFVNVKEILEGKDALSEVTDAAGDDINRTLKEKISELESFVTKLTEEKNNVMKELESFQSLSKESSNKTEEELFSLNNTIQEKDDIITNLKNELNHQLEKLTKVVADNQSFSEQINTQSVLEKEQTENIIKELGEKVSQLSDDLKLKSDEVQGFVNVMSEKDSKIATLEESLKHQLELVAKSEDLNQSLNQSFDQKTSELTQQQAFQQELEDKIHTLKSRLETEIPEKEKKILDLVTQIEQLTNSVQEKEDEIVKRATDIENLKTQLIELKETCIKLENKLKQAEENASLSNKGAVEKLENVQKELELVKSDKEKLEKSFEMERQKIESDLKTVSLELEAQKQLVNEKQSEFTNIKEVLKVKEMEYLKLEEKLASVMESSQLLTEQNNETSKTLNAKLEEIQKLQSQLDALSQEVSVTQTEKCALANNVEDKSKECVLLNQEIEDVKNVIAKTNEEKNALENILKNKEEELKKLQEELSNSSNNLTATESEKLKLLQDLETKDKECLISKQEIESLKKINEEICGDKEAISSSLKTKEESESALEKELADSMKLLETKNAEISKNVSEIETLSIAKKTFEEACAQFKSKLELSEQKVEMLNKDSSEHVMTLQKELSNLKEEKDKLKTNLEQNITVLQKEKEKIDSTLIEEKKINAEKESMVSELQNGLETKENRIIELCQEVENLKQERSLLEKQNNEVQETLQKQLSVTKEELNCSFQEREQKLSSLQAENEKSVNLLKETNECISQKEKIISNLENDVKTRDSKIDTLSSEIKTLQQRIEKISEEKDAAEKSLQMQYAANKEELNEKLKQQEQVAEANILKVQEYENMLEGRTSDLSAKDKDIAGLKAAILEKESQFDELGKMIELSQMQLTQLNENNEKNVKLLEAKEMFISNFKAEMEDKLRAREESLKTEIQNLENIIAGKDEVTNQKDEIISKLMLHNQEQLKQIETLNEEVKKAKELNEKANESSESSFKEFTVQIADLETKYKKLLEEKEKIASEELKTRTDKKNLEEVRDTLMQQKVQQEEVVKDKQAKLEVLQAQVKKMQADFTLHKQELQQKLDVSLAEKEAALELKKHLELQHSVLEELQEELHKSEEKCAKLEAENERITSLTSEKQELANKVKEFERTIKEKTQKLSDIEKIKQTTEEMLKNDQNLLLDKETECSSLYEEIQNLRKDLESSEQLRSRLKLLEEENTFLKLKSEMKQSSANDLSAKSASENINQMDSEERDSLISQIDFLNSIIVDMKQKNEELQIEVDAKDNPFVEPDLNFNEVKKIPPRLFCDICDMFDLHDTDDCPKQESYIDDGEIPNLIPQGVRKLDERPYCNNCEMFGHWTLDCKEEEEY